MSPENPWGNLSNEAPYVLEIDATRLNIIHELATNDRQIQTKLLPQPYVGRPDAPVVLLQQNPSWSEQDLDLMNNETAKNIALGCMNHSLEEYPFYWLSPKLEEHPGFDWWDKRLKALCKTVGHDLGKEDEERLMEGRQIVANNLLCVEFHAYPSKKKDSAVRLPSQEYSFHLVREAVARKALIVICRSQYEWKMAVPELQDNSYNLNNPRSTYVTEGNLPGIWDELVYRIKEGK